MRSFTLTVQQIKTNKRHFFVQIFFLAVLLISMTSVDLLHLIMKQVDQNGTWGEANIKVFTTNEAQEMTHYFIFCFSILCGCALLYFLLTYLINWKTQKPHFLANSQNRQAFFSFLFSEILYILSEILIAAAILLGFFILVQPFYEQILQFFYQQSLDHFTDLPKFVLSNGTSGFAYSLRSPLSFDISSVTLFRFFVHALTHSFGWLFLLATTLFSILYGFTYCRQKRKLVSKHINSTQN